MLQSHFKLGGCIAALVGAMLVSGCKAKAGEFCRTDDDCRDGLACSAGANDGDGGECVANDNDDGDIGTSGPPPFYDLASKRDLGPPDESEDPEDSSTGSETGDDSAGTGESSNSDTGQSSTSDGNGSSTGESSTSTSGTSTGTLPASMRVP